LVTYNGLMRLAAKQLIAALAATIALWSSALPQSAAPQAKPDNGSAAPQVALKKLFPPAYPQMAVIARIYGDVSLEVYVYPDGSVGSVVANSGNPILVMAAVESTKQSQFECLGCNGLTKKSLLYSFQVSTAPADPCCCTAGHESSTPKTAQVTESEGHITLTAPPLCKCPDACHEAWAQAHSKFRSAKCLYLWKCGTRHVAIM
jgi:hypothetical protein